MIGLSDAAPPVRPTASACQVRIVPTGADCLHQHLARLAPADRALRLGRRVARAAIEAFCTRPRHGEPLVLGAFVDGRLVASAELTGAVLRRRGGGGLPVGELVVAVEAPYRRAGLATRLTAEAVHHAAWRQVALVRLAFATSNPAMARLAARLGATCARVGDELRAELCTGWLDDELVPILIESSPGFRPLTMH